MLPSSFAIIILGTSAVVMMSLAVLVFRIDRKAPANLFFSLWMLALSAWALTLTAFFASDSDQSALLWMRAAYATAIIGIVAFFYFATQFPRPSDLHPVVHVANFLTLVGFSAAIMLTPLIVRTVTGPDRAEHVAISASGWFLYAAYLLFNFLSAHILLFAKYRDAKGIERIQLKYVVWSVFIGGEIFGVLFNLILPSPIFERWDLIWLGPTATAIIIVPFVAYAVTKHSLFNFRGVITEILVFYMIVFMVVDALTADSAWAFAFRGVIAAGMAAFGIMLIRRIGADERHRRQLQDLTRKLSQANEHLKEADKLKDEFISIASHQLRTPITANKGYLSLLLEGAYGPIEGAVKEKMEQMFEMNERLVKMVSNMLNVTRIQNGKIEFAPGRHDVREIVDEALREMALAAKQDGVTLAYEDPPDAPLHVYVDREKLLEAITNLIDNAIKYGKGGRVAVQVKARPRTRDVYVAVSDTGQGMSKEDASRVFQKFFRTASGKITSESGTGLGLYVVAMFLHGMGGDIWIERTAPGKGTTFAMCLPTEPEQRCRAPKRPWARQ